MKVSHDLRCPHCGEGDGDRLLIGVPGREGITCATCGRTYMPARQGARPSTDAVTAVTRFDDMGHARYKKPYGGHADCPR